MRKYRSGGFQLGSGPWSVSEVLKNTNFLYVFVAWNVFAYSAYSWYQNKRVKDKEKWARMSSAQRYLSLITKPDDQLRVVKWKGLHHVETKTVDAATYIDPDKHQ